MVALPDSLASQVFGVLFEHGAEAAFVAARTSGRILQANRQLEEMTGCARESLVGRHAGELFRLEEGHPGRSSSIIERPGLHEDIGLMRLDGYTTFVTLTVAHIDHGGMGDLAACVARDTTERRALERELISKHAALYAAHAELERAVTRLEDAQTRLEQRNRDIALLGEKLAQVGRRAAIGEFSAGIAHSMNNPMAALSSAVRQISRRIDRYGDPELSAELSRFLQRSHDAVARMESIVQSVRRAHRAGALDECGRPLVLADELDVALSLFDGRLDGVEVRRDYPDDTTVWAPADALHQVFSNLVDNAVRAMSDGGVLTIRIERSARGTVVSVIDTGCGVSDDRRADIFEPFVSGTGDGTGLGLSTAQRLARQWGGDVVCVSRRTGARFDITIPDGGPE